MSTRPREERQPDRFLLFATVFLCGAGLVMVTSASVAFAYTQHESAFYYAERQTVWMVIGFVALFLLSRIDYRKLRPLALPGAATVVLLMILVLVPHLGVTVNGARRWFDAGPLGTFQPSELGKLAFAVYVAHWIDRNAAVVGTFQRGLLPIAAMLALPGAATVVLLMILVLVPHLGVTVNGARRWFDAGPLGTFQPSELGKLAFAVYVAHWIDRNAAVVGTFQRGLLPIAAMLAGVLGLLMLEKDVGTSIVMVGIVMSAYWAGGGRFRHVALLVAFLGLAFIAVTLFEPYRFARLVSFRNPFADPLGTGFQSTQALYGLGSGGFFGVGIGHSVEKYGWLPEAHTDFIFAITGEETGLAGTTLVMLGFLVFAVRGYRAALRAPDRFGVVLAVAITTWITFEALLNMATVTNTLPIAGVPLPFFSYGGTALATTLAAVGVLLSIARRGSSAATGITRSKSASFDSGRRDRRAPLSGARGRAGLSR